MNWKKIVARSFIYGFMIIGGGTTILALIIISVMEPIIGVVLLLACVVGAIGVWAIEHAD